MSCDLLNYTLPPTYRGCTWDGLTWSVASDDTEFADTLSLAVFQIQDDDGNVALTLSSAVNGEVTINVSTAGAWSITVEPRNLTITAGSYRYALVTTDSAGREKPRMEGKLRIKPDPSK